MKTIICLLLVAIGCNARPPFPDQTDDDFQQDCLSTSNNYRAKHHAPAFEIDQEAVEYAKSRCNLISQSEGLSHGHAGLEGHGENLFWGGSGALGTCQDAIDSWYNEVEDYDFSNPGFSGSTGHFTQLVWKGSTGVGCARCGGQGSEYFETYVACEYKPPGNVVGQFPDNVQAP